MIFLNENIHNLTLHKKIRNMLHRTTLIISLLILSMACLAQSVVTKTKSGKYGLSDENGDWVTQPIYDEMKDFDDYPYTLAKLKGKWGMIDQQGKTILPFEYTNVLGDEYLFGEYQYKMVEKNKKYGIVNQSTGKIFIECIYEKPFGFTDGILPTLGNLSVVYRNNKAGMINEKGVEFVPCIFDGGKEPFKDIYLDIYVLAKQNNKAGLIDTLGNLAVPCVYDDIIATEDFNLLDVVKNKKHGLFSLTARKEIIAPLYDEPITFNEDYAYVRLNKKYGALDKDGKVIVPFKFTSDDEVYLEVEKLQKEN